jgi:ATP-dependent DNA ligase
VIDGEAVLLGVDGRSDFNGLHSRKHDHEVEFYAFDILVSDGEDVRRLPLSMRKTNLARLLGRRVDDFNGKLTHRPDTIGVGASTGQGDQMWLMSDSAAVAFILVALMLAVVMMVT